MGVNEVKGFAEGGRLPRQINKGFGSVVYREQIKWNFTIGGHAGLDVALHEPVKEVVDVKNTGLAVARDRARAINGDREMAIARLSNQLFCDPLAAVVAASGNRILSKVGLFRYFSLTRQR